MAKSKAQGEETALTPAEAERRRKQRELQAYAAKLQADGSIYKPQKHKRKLLKEYTATEGHPKPNKKDAGSAKKKKKKSKHDTPTWRPYKATQVVILPIYWNMRHEEKEGVLAAAAKAQALLVEAGITTLTDTANQYTPGQKMKYWETAGVRVRVELGPKDALQGTAVVALSGEPGTVAQKKSVNMAVQLVREVQAQLAKAGVTSNGSAAGDGVGDEEGGPSSADGEQEDTDEAADDGQDSDGEAGEEEVDGEGEGEQLVAATQPSGAGSRQELPPTHTLPQTSSKQQQQQQQHRGQGLAIASLSPSQPLSTSEAARAGRTPKAAAQKPGTDRPAAQQPTSSSRPDKGPASAAAAAGLAAGKPSKRSLREATAASVGPSSSAADDEDDVAPSTKKAKLTHQERKAQQRLQLLNAPKESLTKKQARKQATLRKQLWTQQQLEQQTDEVQHGGDTELPAATKSGRSSALADPEAEHATSLQPDSSQQGSGASQLVQSSKAAFVGGDDLEDDFDIDPEFLGQAEEETLTLTKAERLQRAKKAAKEKKKKSRFVDGAKAWDADLDPAGAEAVGAASREGLAVVRAPAVKGKKSAARVVKF